jgi:hypothetical protein
LPLPKPTRLLLPPLTSIDPSPLALLAALLVTGDQRIAERGIDDFGDKSIETLVRAGFLIPDGQLDSVICEACSEPHLVPVILDQERQQYDAYCPLEGFLGRTHEEVAALSFTIAGAAVLLGRAMSAAFGPGRDRPRTIDDDAWLLGYWSIAGRWTSVVIALSIGRATTARRVGDALASLPRPEQGLVLASAEAAGFHPPAPFLCIPFESAFELDDDGGIQVATGPIVAAATITSAPLLAKGGRPGIGPQVVTVLDSLLAQRRISRLDSSLSGIVAASWHLYFPGEQPPKSSTIRKYAALWRQATKGD